MHYYKGKIRLNGSLNNEVWKVVSAPELLILQFIHGEDAVSNVEEVKNNKLDLYMEKNRLKEMYDKALHKKNEQSIDKIFGALGTLPERLPEHQLRRYNIFGEDLEIFDPKSLKNKGKDLDRQQEEDNLNSVRSTDEVNFADLMD